MPIERPITHPDPDISVVIPTIPEYELKSLPALEEQTVENFEVIVVSDGTINRCQARNKGIEIAQGDIIAQTDDDCLPPNRWVERIKTHFERENELVLIEGPLDKLHRPPRHYIGANMAYKRECALEIGGFDSVFSGWRADTDFGWRMEEAFGVNRCCHDDELEVFHDGPMRSDVDFEKEHRFRRRHTRKYFTVLYNPKVPFGESIGQVIAGCYRVSPSIGDRVIDSAKVIKSLL